MTRAGIGLAGRGLAGGRRVVRVALALIESAAAGSDVEITV